MTKEGIRYYLSDPKRLFYFAASRGLLNWMSDESFIKAAFRLKFGYPLDLNNAKTFNEKLQWLKLYNRDPLYTRLVDKYEVRDYIEEKLGGEYLIPLVGGPWDSADEIDFDSLPDKFVLKTTHDSGGVLICRDKSQLDIENAKEKLRKRLDRDFFYSYREWPYKNVKHRIVAEKYMEDRFSENLPVVKIFCFNGQPRIIQSIQNDKTKQESIDYFDTDWTRLELRQNFPNSAEPMPRPSTLNEMLEIAEKLSRDHAFIRTDLYEINGKVYFSELTFYSDTGLEPFYPNEWDGILGSWIELPEKRMSY